MSSLLNQRPRVLEVLRKEGRISRNYAIDHMRITRLSDIIFKLRNEGWGLETTYEKHPTDTVYVFRHTPKK